MLTAVFIILKIAGFLYASWWWIIVLILLDILLKTK